MAAGETKGEQLDRELIELLQELRVVIPGVQVLLAFLLTAPFQQRFTELPGSMRNAFFLIGAYQDIMGDLHNLFGRVTEVHVFLDPDEEDGWYIEEVIEGSTIGEVLAMTQWDKVELMRLLKAQVDDAIKTDRLKPNDAMRLLDDYERLLQEYTYLSLNGVKLPPQSGSWLPLS